MFVRFINEDFWNIFESYQVFIYFSLFTKFIYKTATLK